MSYVYNRRPHRDQPPRDDGKPVVRGTRITIELLLRKISEGATESDLLDAYPRLQCEDIRAAVAYESRAAY